MNYRNIVKQNNLDIVERNGRNIVKQNNWDIVERNDRNIVEQNVRDIIEQYEKNYLSKVFGFCRCKMRSREDAEDLASEISIEVIKTIQSGKKIENLNAFVWSVSNHMFCKWLRSKKRRTAVCFDESYVFSDSPDSEYILKEQTNILRREIALLSENYRKSVVLYYFDNKSCDEIARVLKMSTGTVKWWLHEARKLMKEGIITMREYGEKSFNPESLSISCQGLAGADNEPMSLAKRKLPQNILLAAYREPMSVRQLCAELGTPAAYIEDEVFSLVENQLMKEVSGGKYQTGFVILPGDNTKIAHDLYGACFPGYFNELIGFLDNHRILLSGGEYNTANFSWERLLWVYIHIFTDIMLSKYKYDECNIITYQDMPIRPNGGKWIALGYNNGWFSDIDNSTSDWSEYVPFDGPVQKMKECAQGFFHYWSGLDSNVLFEIPDEVFTLCRDIIKGNISIDSLDDDQKYLFSIAVSKKLFIKDAAEFRQNYYFTDRLSLEKIKRLSYELYGKVKNYFVRAYQLILGEYESTVPKHLHEQMGNFLSNHLGFFVTCSLYEGIKRGVLSKPDENNREWLSLFVSEM